MKMYISILFALLCLPSLAQTTVTTLTPEIKGSGGLSLDENGNLLIADFGDFLSVPDPDGLPNDVLIMDTSNNITQYSTGFVGASGNDFDSNGILFQSDIRDNAIFKIVAGVRTFVTDTGIAAPVGIAFDSADNFYVCNCGDDTIQKVTPGGVSTQFASGTDFSCPNGITVDENDNLYVSNFNNGNIIKITPAGATTVLNATPGGTTGGASNGHLDYHEATQTLFIASHGSNRIYALRLADPANLIPIAGSGARGNEDGPGTTASFSRPNGVAVTPDGDSIYINSAVPTTNVPNGPLNPQLIRLITGVQSILSVAEETKSSFDAFLYPNPASDMVKFEVRGDFENKSVNIQLFDVHGRLLKEIGDISMHDQQISSEFSVAALASGTYFLVLNNRNGRLFTTKLVKI